jgi:hypothetical protein
LPVSLSGPCADGERRYRRATTNKQANKFPSPHGRYVHKHAVLTLVDRKGEARSFHIDRADTVMPKNLVEDDSAGVEAPAEKPECG